MAKESNEESTNISLSQTNPEVFSAVPRLGGYLKVSKSLTDYVPPSTSSSKNSKVGSSASRCTCKATNVPDTPNSPDFDQTAPSYVMLQELSNKPSSTCKLSGGECFIEEDADPKIDPKTQSSKMLSITISCIMLLASGADVSYEYLTIAETYLDCMKDENGDCPPNIEGLLTKICKLRKAKMPSEPSNNSENVSAGGGVCEKKVEFKKTGQKKKKIVPKVKKTEKYIHKK